MLKTPIFRYCTLCFFAVPLRPEKVANTTVLSLVMTTRTNLPVGVYTICIGTRTAQKNQADDEGNHGMFNAQNADGIWDKYIYAQVDEETPLMAPFAVGGNTGAGFPTYIYTVTAKEGQTLTIGAVENYTSGKASGHNWDADTGAYESKDYWDTNTYVREAQIYFTAPFDGYDYEAAAKKLADEIATDIEAIEAAPAKTGTIYNLAGQLVDENYKGIVIINGVKVLQ